MNENTKDDWILQTYGSNEQWSSYEWTVHSAIIIFLVIEYPIGEKDCVERNELDRTSGDRCSDVSLITGKIRTSNLNCNSSQDYLQ